MTMLERRYCRVSVGWVRSAVALLVLLAEVPAAAEVVTLEELEGKAALHRPALEAAMARVAEASAGVELAEAAYSPTGGLNMDASGAPGGRLVRVASTTGDDYLVQGSRALGERGAFIPEPRYGAVLAMQARLYDFGRTRSEVAAARARVATARAHEQVTRASLVRDLRVAYLGWLAARILHSSAEQAVSNARARRDLVEERIAAGARPQSDLGPILYDEALAELDESEARGRELSARLDVEHAAGVKLPLSAVPDPGLLERMPPPAAPKDHRASPESLELESRHRLALASVHAHESEGAPVLSASAEAGLRGQTSTVFPAYRAAVVFSFPLWDGGAASASARASRAEASAVAAEEREYRDSLKADRDRAWSDWTIAAERVHLAEVLRNVSIARARDAEDRYHLGDGKIEPLLEADTALSRAERELLSAKMARTDAVFRLRY